MVPTKALKLSTSTPTLAPTSLPITSSTVAAAPVPEDEEEEDDYPSAEEADEDYDATNEPDQGESDSEAVGDKQSLRVEQTRSKLIKELKAAPTFDRLLDPYPTVAKVAIVRYCQTAHEPYLVYKTPAGKVVGTPLRNLTPAWTLEVHVVVAMMEYLNHDMAVWSEAGVLNVDKLREYMDETNFYAQDRFDDFVRTLASPVRQSSLHLA